MKKAGIIFGVMIIMLSFQALAAISLSEPLDIYNLGDKLYISASGIIGADSGNLNIDLQCDNYTTNLVKISARVFSLEDEQSYSVPYKVLDKSDLEVNSLYEIVGECQIIATLGSRVATTKTFTISNEISVASSLDQDSYDPGEEMKLTVNAVKKNGYPVNGFVRISNATTFEKAIEEGDMIETFSLPSTTEAGTYVLNVFVYDKDSTGTLNSGSEKLEFTINQVASSIILSLSEESIEPENGIILKAEVYDQSGIEMSGTLSTQIISSEDEVIETTLNSGEEKQITFASNATPGTYRIITTFGNTLAQEREFEILEVQKIDLEIEGSVLTVTNIGNAIYNKTIELQIGEETQELVLNINVGETRKFSLAAPNGEYDVTVGDGDTSISRQVLLTGNAISVKSSGNGFLENYAILWIFLVIIIGGVGFVFYKKSRKTKKTDEFDSKKSKLEKHVKLFKKTGKNIGRKAKSKIPKSVMGQIENSLHFTNKSPKVQGLDDESYHHEDPSMIDLTKHIVQKAESSVTLKGEKHTSSVISIAIKNYDGLSEIAKDSFQKIVSSNQGKGLIDSRNDYVFIVFSPVITRTYGNEILAVKSAMKIQSELVVYNRKFKDKIDFNIGINSGEMIASKANGKFKYTGIGSTISLAKRIADSGNKKIFVSESIRKKLMRDVNVVKTKDIGENKIYEVLEVKDRAGDQKRLEDIMKRMNY